MYEACGGNPGRHSPPPAESDIGGASQTDQSHRTAGFFNSACNSGKFLAGDESPSRSGFLEHMISTNVNELAPARAASPAPLNNRRLLPTEPHQRPLARPSAVWTGNEVDLVGSPRTSCCCPSPGPRIQIYDPWSHRRFLSSPERTVFGLIPTHPTATTATFSPSVCPRLSS